MVNEEIRQAAVDLCWLGYRTAHVARHYGVSENSVSQWSRDQGRPLPRFALGRRADQRVVPISKTQHTEATTLFARGGVDVPAVAAAVGLSYSQAFAVRAELALTMRAADEDPRDIIEHLALSPHYARKLFTQARTPRVRGAQRKHA